MAGARPRTPTLRRARHHGVDGVIVLAVDDAEEPEVKKLIASGIPVIAVDLVVADRRASYVASDNVGGARLAVRHLHGLGHRRIADDRRARRHEAGRPTACSATAQSCRSSGSSRRPGYEIQGDFYFESGEQAMRELLALPEPPTAVFAAVGHDGRRARSRRSRRRACACPSDIAIVGFDDIQLAELVSRP